MVKNFALIMFVLLITLASCAKSGLKKSPSNNLSFEITFLFESEGIKVYRFFDAGHYHYFASRGEISTAKLKNMGKQYYTFHEKIQTLD